MKNPRVAIAARGVLFSNGLSFKIYQPCEA